MSLQFKEALKEIKRESSVDFNTAWTLFSGAKTWDSAIELFSEASRVRDERLGNEITLRGHITMITPCLLDPPCKYCSASSSVPAIRANRAVLRLKELTEAVEYIEKRGMSYTIITGGTILKGFDAEVKSVVKAIREITDMDLWINVGPSLSTETLQWLKHMGVNNIGCSLETINSEAFKDAKPGDDFNRRIELMEAIEREGMKLWTVVMTGLGTNQDLIQSILYLRRFRNVESLRLSVFKPIAGTPWEQKQPAYMLDAFKAMAIARLLFPDSEVGLADGGGLDVLAHELMAGAGNSLNGILINTKKKEDMVDYITRMVTDLGFKVRPGSSST